MDNNTMSKKLLEMIGKMDKKDLQDGLNKVSSMLGEDKEKLADLFKNQNNK